MNSHKASPIKRLMAALQSAWEKLSHPDSGPGREPWQNIQERYQHQRDATTSSDKPHKKDLLQRMSTVNGNLKLNQYVEDPAPGPSQRQGPQGTNRVRGKSQAASEQK
ncbi:MAG: hypothetical protein REI12_01785 [Pedobacter sp.]|nr:hypothetical protein [Pedobacter sp.]